MFVAQRRKERGGMWERNKKGTRKGEREADAVNLLCRSQPSSGAETGSVTHGGRCCLSVEGAGEGY